jgi:hypothetical protein
MSVVSSGVPSPAEVIRSVMAAAGSLDVVAECGRARVIGRHVVDDAGRLLLHLPADSRLVRCAVRATGGVPVVSELTDVAPIAVPERVRAQVRLNGVLTVIGQRHGAGADPGGTAVVLVSLAGAQLIRGAGYAFVGADELVGAPVDPVAEREAAWLIHLADSHPGVVDLLARLVAPQALHGVRRVYPLRLDRYGIVLRLERARAYRDVRLSFPVALRCREDVAEQMDALLRQAHRCRSRRLRL